MQTNQSWLRVTVATCGLAILGGFTWYLTDQVIAGAVQNRDSITKVRSLVERAKSPQRDYSVTGKLELSDDNEPVILRFSSEAYLAFQADDIVLDSLHRLDRHELNDLSISAKMMLSKPEDWFRLKLRHGSKCRLVYRKLNVEFTLDRDKQKPFYIDTEKTEVVYLDEKKEDKNVAHNKAISNADICCLWQCEDKTNMEVTVYTNRACCCNNNKAEAYGFVGCKDNWRSSKCLD